MKKAMPMSFFTEGAEPTDLFEKVQKRMLEHVNSEEYRQREIKRQQEVAILLPQVVGCEQY